MRRGSHKTKRISIFQVGGKGTNVKAVIDVSDDDAGNIDDDEVEGGLDLVIPISSPPTRSPPCQLGLRT